MNDLMTKSFLSYVELKKQAREDTAVELAAGELSRTTDEPILADFFLQVDSIKTQMEEITNLLTELQTLNEETKSSHSAKILRGLRDRIQSDTVTVLRKAKDVKISLESLDSANISNRAISHLYKEGSPVDRTRVSVTNGLRAKFREAMNEFLFLREKILSDYRNDLKRKYFVATGEEANEETIENMVSGKWEGFEAGKMKEEMEDLPCKERHQAVLDLQRSLTKLHQVFLDMAVLVDAQGERIDDIEENVAKASEFVGGGTDSLYYAKQMKDKSKSTWTTCWWVIAAIFVVLFVCLISLLAS
ncbi:SYP112 [Linum grandiflorum]